MNQEKAKELAISHEKNQKMDRIIYQSAGEEY